MPFESYRIALVMKNPIGCKKKLLSLGFIPSSVENSFELDGNAFVLEASVIDNIIELEFAYNNSSLVHEKFLQIASSLWDGVDVVNLACAVEKDKIQFNHNEFSYFKDKFLVEIGLLRNCWAAAFGCQDKKTYVKDAYCRIDAR